MQVANEISIDQIKATRLASEGVIKHVADVRLLVTHDVPEDQMYGLMLKQAREYLRTPQLDRGVVRINNSNFTTIFDPNGNVEIQHANGHYNIKSPILMVIHEYIKKVPGLVYGFSEEHVIEVILRLSVARTELLSAKTKAVEPTTVFETPEEIRSDGVHQSELKIRRR